MMKKIINLIQKYYKVVFTTLIFLIVIYLFESYGLVGSVIFILAFGLYRLWKHRKTFIEVKRYIESLIWGKPLYLFSKEELKNTKIKIVWNSKKDTKKETKDIFKNIFGKPKNVKSKK